MKPHHAAVLALAGWYLITPPQAKGRFDTSAPWPQWRLEAGFATGDECKKTLGLLKSRALEEGRADDIDAAKDAQCVATDDARLKAN